MKDSQEGTKLTEEESGLPILVRIDSSSKMLFANMVPRKGECEYAIKRAEQDVTKVLGYRKVVFKGDQEPALQKLLDHVGMAVGENVTREDRRAEIGDAQGNQTIREESPVGESQSNGEVENAIQRIQGMYRTMKDDMEANLGQKNTRGSPSDPMDSKTCCSNNEQVSSWKRRKDSIQKTKRKEFQEAVCGNGRSCVVPEAKDKRKKQRRIQMGRRNLAGNQRGIGRIYNRNSERSHKGQDSKEKRITLRKVEIPRVRGNERNAVGTSTRKEI